MPALKTVKIKHGDGFSIINATDFDPEIHKIFEEKEAEPEFVLAKANTAQLEAYAAEKFPDLVLEGTVPQKREQIEAAEAAAAAKGDKD